MFLGNEDKVYILDKAEGNPTQLNGHPAWAAVWDVNTRQSTPMEIFTNTFCSSGYHLPNGSYMTFGGNGAVGPAGNISDVLEPGGYTGLYDTIYGDYDGTKALRILSPCDLDNDDLVNNPDCQWFDNATILSMQQQRWYSTAEALGDGTIVIIGGYTSGGYVNRNYPNVDPEFEGGAATSTYEFYPSKGSLQTLNFLIRTSGLNAYAHAFTMPSGKLFLQANYSSSTSYRSNLSCACTDECLVSSLGSDCKPGDTTSRHAWRDHPCLSCLWWSGDASSHSREQLDANRHVLWWFQHDRLLLG